MWVIESIQYLNFRLCIYILNRNEVFSKKKQCAYLHHLILCALLIFFLSFFSSLLFLRVGYVIGNAGLLYGLLQLFISYVILCCTVCSISAIATNGSVKGHSIYIRTESLYCLLSALMNWFKLVYGPFRPLQPF